MNEHISYNLFFPHLWKATVAAKRIKYTLSTADDLSFISGGMFRRRVRVTHVEAHKSMLIKFKPLQSSAKYQLLKTESWWQFIQKWATLIRCNHEGGRQRTDRGFQRADSVRAGKAHWSEYGDAFLRGQVVAEWGGTHGAVTGGRPGVHHGGQNEWFCEVWGKTKRKQNQSES